LDSGYCSTGGRQRLNFTNLFLHGLQIKVFHLAGAGILIVKEKTTIHILFGLLCNRMASDPLA